VPFHTSADDMAVENAAGAAVATSAFAIAEQTSLGGQEYQLERWDKHYSELMAFKAKFGHVNIHPRRSTVDF
jgi:hypothetical protein